jgi:CheY-like chemotaxis protein
MIARANPKLDLPKASKGTPIAILLVDDDPDCRTLIREAIICSKINNDVYEVSNGEAALQFLRRQGPFSNVPRPGLIYLDIEMPGINGIDLLRTIKADELFKDIPVVMMTGVCDEQQMHAAACNGANSYTIKPANAQLFLNTVTQCTNYWLTIHQYPQQHLPPEACRR